jgi:YidC/Oxa1 family membrane protein insertase
VDKKNTTIGTLFVIAALASMWWAAKQTKPIPAPPTPQAAAAAMTPAAAGTAATTTTTASAPAAATAVSTSPAAPATGAEVETVTPEHAGEKITALENSYIQVRFTDFGGAISDVALKKYQYSLTDRTDPALFNDRHVDPIFGFVGWAGLDRNTRFQLVSQSATEIVYRAILDNTWDVTRRYVLSPDEGKTTDPYQLWCETTFHNRSGKASVPLQVEVALGTAEPVSTVDFGRMLATGTSFDSKQDFVGRYQLEPSTGMLGLGLGAHAATPVIASTGPFTWAVVKNQFFSSIFTPDQPGAGLVTRRVRLPGPLPDSDSNAFGLTGAADVVLPAVPAGGSYQLGGQLYVGPTEYKRLSNMDVFKAGQDGVMQFGKYTGWASEILLRLMVFIHTFVPNWGFSIILTTLTLRLAFMPLTLMAARSGRRMQKIAPLMTALKEKYKDSPQKLQQATIELYKEHKVNPAGGCIPMLLPLPFFLGFYYMLMGAAELRYAPWLWWVHDLSAPDTVGFILGFPIRILPLLFVVANFVQMQITPQPNATGPQAAMMKFMPLFTLLIYYRYSCALSLYSTTNALIAIVQQVIVNKRKDDGDPANKAGGDSPGGRPTKNVTPKKKR